MRRNLPGASCVGPCEGPPSVAAKEGTAMSGLSGVSGMSNLSSLSSLSRSSSLSNASSLSSLRRLSAILLLLGLAVTACGGSDGDPADAPADPAAADDTAASPDETDPSEATDPDGDTDTGGDAEPSQDAVSAMGDETSEPDPTANDGDATNPQVTIFFVRSNDAGIWIEPELHELDGPTEGIARAAMELLFEVDAHDPALTSVAPADVQVLATNIRDRVLIVDVSDEVTGYGAGSAQEMAFAQQLAHTGAAFDTVDAVELWVDGEPIDELWGHLDWSQPFQPDPYAVSPITFSDPALGPSGATADIGSVEVAGEARVFEATFGLRLYDAAGELVAEKFVMASEGAPGRGTWEHTFTINDPGTYTIEATEDDPSDGEGRPPFVVTRSVEVG